MSRLAIWFVSTLIVASVFYPQSIQAAVGDIELAPEGPDLDVGPLLVEPIPPIEAESAEEEPAPRPYAPLRPAATCPDDVETLTALLIRDLPGYTNRVLQRTVAALPGNETDGREAYRPSYVLVAGRAEFEPIDLESYAFTTEPDAGGPLSQVFFTTLSRQYAGLRDRQLEEYHWLFLTQSEDGWRLAFMFSAIDDDLKVGAALPHRENSEGSVGKAVQLWLRDCRAGAIYPESD